VNPAASRCLRRLRPHSEATRKRSLSDQRAFYRMAHGRTTSAILALCLALGGCAVSTEPQRLGYGDYVALSCNQLAQEALHLMREAADRSEHILGNDQARRETAMAQLKSVKQVRADKQC
jgi:hypothetical protein